jgi:AcrR family transcriptional regulator
VDPNELEAVARSAGRPRAVHRDLSLNVREEILTAAAGLFEANGYTATSTSSIAGVAGLRQASLFHYFARKQDILLELLARTVRPTLKAVRQNRLEQFDPDVALWQLVHMDVANLCQGPHNLGALQLLPEARGPEFEWYWRRRYQLFRVYSDQVARGFVSGAFSQGDPRTTSEVVFGLVESVIIARPQFRRRTSTPVAIADAALGVCGVPVEQIRRVAGTPAAPESR